MLMPRVSLSTEAGRSAANASRAVFRLGRVGRHGSHAKIRALGEQAMDILKQWRLLHKPRCSTTRIIAIVQAVLILHLATSA